MKLLKILLVSLSCRYILIYLNIILSILLDDLLRILLESGSKIMMLIKLRILGRIVRKIRILFLV